MKLDGPFKKKELDSIRAVFAKHARKGLYSGDSNMEKDNLSDQRTYLQTKALTKALLQKARKGYSAGGSVDVRRIG